MMMPLRSVDIAAGKLGAWNSTKNGGSGHGLNLFFHADTRDSVAAID
jgi:hypothetical protein